MAHGTRGGDRTQADRDAEFAAQWASVARGVLTVQQSFASGIEAVGLSLPYYSVLTLLLEADEHRLPMSRIARDLSMTTGGFTKLADRMGRDGLIDRRGSSGDRRVVFAALTDAGREAPVQAVQAYRRLLHEKVLSVISPDELATMADSAQRLSDPEHDTQPDLPAFRMSPPEPGTPDRRRSRSR